MSLLAVLLLALTAQAAADAAPKPGTPKMPAVPKLQIKASPAPAAAPSKAAPAPAKPVTPAQPSGNPPRLVPEAAPAGVWRYTLRVTAGVVAPDCGGTRKALLINNMFQPTMEVASGDTLEVMVTNNIPSDWVDITNNGSISIHWHGFHLIGNPWYDGTAYIAQCPIPRGQSFLYRFQVNEPEG
ncbi:Laccase-4 [Monoraphidium neglectum]|uniref:Laccase-4 n=1 Tax=Monoraphidium neglectum TaxID=145388 RepID=A0A0D2MC79_9CHLO|nr:Laccase-4 [Monoraphidium neglectum]KIY92885.1 Laccase-4 [Monoraphidium neglectum]|eukprot:XP_013891905.1 Laccase-4 [Monoraphidium neglectum]